MKRYRLLREGCRTQSRGSTLVGAIILSFIVLLMSTALMFSFSSELKLNKKTYASSETFYAAQAGIEHGLMLIEQSESDTILFPSEEFRVYDDGTHITTYKISIAQNIPLNGYTINSIGKIVENGSVVDETILWADIDEDFNVSLRNR